MDYKGEIQKLKNSKQTEYTHLPFVIELAFVTSRRGIEDEKLEIQKLKNSNQSRYTHLPVEIEFAFITSRRGLVG